MSRFLMEKLQAASACCWPVKALNITAFSAIELISLDLLFTKDAHHRICFNILLFSIC